MILFTLFTLERASSERARPVTASYLYRNRCRLEPRALVRENLIRLALALCLAAGSALTAHSADTKTPVSRGASLYASCVRCHGTQAEGLDTTMAPRLAGREDWFIVKQIDQFRRRERGKDDSKETGFLPSEARTQFMHPVAGKLNRSETRAIIAYVATLRPGPVPPARQGDASRGQKLYATCIECHSKAAEGNRRRGAPRLTGQHDWYLFNQLRDFRMGWRGADSKNPHVKLMRGRLDLDDDALHDLAAYIVSLNFRESPGSVRP